MDLNGFVQAGAEDVLRTATKYYARSPRGLRYMMHALTAMPKAAKRRDRLEADGTHVPLFLIASISSTCNLACTGCYAHATGTVGEAARSRELDAGRWAAIFNEAQEIGVSFILLAGGEPTMRRDVVEVAATCRDIIFPVFTNGTTFDEGWLSFFDEHRNMVPVFSMEGTDEQTDERRGTGVAARVREAMLACTKHGILWGVSITVTTENLGEVTSDAFVGELHERGCGLIIYNEYVPIAACTTHLALPMTRHDELMERVERISTHDAFGDLSAIAFPGSEEQMGGCLAAGRGFFHISQAGNAEPCPFSPVSVANVAEVGLLGALRSPFFARVQRIEEEHADEHMGGCTLFTHRAEVLKAKEAALATAV